MRLSKDGYPVIILSHRKREFLETAVHSLRQHGSGITDVIVVDDSGDHEHHEWLSHDYQFSLSSPDGSNVGYLGAMQTVWETARELDTDYVLLWEEDFILTKPLQMFDMAVVMGHDDHLAQLNLQRQAVYKIERRFGYMQSHARRGYGLVRQETCGVPWVRRRTPFTTNPSLISNDVFLIDWPSRVEADKVPGGAEPAMGQLLEQAGYHFGWLGVPDHPHTHHVGTEMKTGKGY